MDPKDADRGTRERGEAREPGGEKALQRTEAETVPTRVVVRDLIIFQLKLALDGLGDLVLAPLSVLAFVIDLLPGRSRGKTFYRILRAGERWDRWLSLYRPSTEAGQTKEGLLQAGRVDADTFLGKVEEVVRTSARKAADRDRP